MSNTKYYQITLIFFSGAISYCAAANENSLLSYNNFGGIGLIQTPSGRVAPEGEFSIGTSINNSYRFYYTSLQLFPWLETTLRYAQIPDRLYSQDPSFSGNNILADKSIDVKFRLFEESRWLPEIALGIRDIGGTGLFDGEYIAASKRIKNVDFNLGIGWGYLGNSGNLYKNNQVNCGRNGGLVGTGGSFNYKTWFTGCVAVFAGLEYQTPWQPLKFKLEYEGNDYKSDIIANSINQQSPINLGLVYQPAPWVTFSTNFERGNTWTAGFSINTNFNKATPSWLDTPTPAYQVSNSENINWEQVTKDLESVAGYSNAKIYSDQNSISVVASQNKYRDRKKALENTAVLLANTGTKVKQFNIIEQEKNLNTIQTQINTQKYAQVANQEYIDADIEDSQEIINPNTPNGELIINNEQSFSYSLSPVLKQSFGGAESFYFYNLGIDAAANYWLNSNFELSSGLYLNLLDNYDKFNFEIPQDGTNVKRVRTLIRSYLTDSPVRVNNLQLTHFSQFNENFYSQIYAGYLETMFAGAGGELLYRPLLSNWALAIDVNYVIQRTPNSQFALFKQALHKVPNSQRTYSVQTGGFTGHLTAYYQPQWQWMNDLTIATSFGQYLAGDKGVTLNVSKQFDSGVSVGVFATKTNLSAQEFGEGSFNKGFYISLPLDLFTIKPSTSRSFIGWAPLTRDGGQMLNKKYSLYGLTEQRSLNFTK